MKSIASSIICTCIFSIKYLCCLPFSGYMPFINCDGITFYTAYLIYAKEIFTFPFGLIENLSFPFHDADILQTGAIPLFAIIFKLLSRIHSYFYTFYYFVLVEQLAIFFTAYYTYKILDRLHIKTFSLKLLGSMLCSLSLVVFMTSKSSSSPCLIIHFPIYMAFAYFYIKQNYKALICVFLIATLADPYILFGIMIMMTTCTILSIIDFKKFKMNVSVLLISILMSYLILKIVVVCGISKLEGGLTSLGFTYWSGTRVADVFSLIIPYGHKYSRYLLRSDEIPGCGYIGNVALVLLITAIIISLNRSAFERLKLRVISKLYITTFSPVTAITISALVLYVLSWGYRIHILGYRLECLPFTPQAILADNFSFLYHIRSVARMVYFPSMWAILLIIAWYGKNTRINLSKFTVIILISLHLVEISDWLRPVPVTKNVILDMFTKDEAVKIKTLARSNALLIVPDIKQFYTEEYLKNTPYHKTWDKYAYAMAYHADIPTNIERAARDNGVHSQIIKSDVADILNGNILSIFQKYGWVTIGCPADIGLEIVKKSDVPLNYNKVNDIAILTWKGD